MWAQSQFVDRIATVMMLNEFARPGMPVFKLSAKTGEGMEKYLEFLASRLSASLNHS
jgi:Ni2+-binding GTPase involved in maturation of urease and hydrogenase